MNDKAGYNTVYGPWETNVKPTFRQPLFMPLSMLSHILGPI